MKTKKQQTTVFIINFILGSSVILSYIWGFVNYPESVSKLWGNVPESLLPFYTSWMFVAAVGYLIALYFVVAKCDPAEAKVADKFPYSVYNWIFAIILIPSAIWMPLTFQMILTPSLPTWVLIRIVLSVVALGTILLIAAIINTAPVKSLWSRRLAITGSIAFSIQTVLLDAIVWTYYFPVE